MTTLVPGTKLDNSDSNNLAIRGLAGLTIAIGVIGVFVAILGLASSPTTNSYGVQTKHNYTIAAAGFSLVGAAVSIWVLLLFFWGWRYERRQHPTPGFRVAQPAPAYPDNQLTAGGIVPRSVESVMADATKYKTALSVTQLGASRMVTIAFAGQSFLLVEDLADVMGTTSAAIKKVSQQYLLGEQNFHYALNEGPEAASEVGLFIPVRSLPVLLKRIPAARGQELLNFLNK